VNTREIKNFECFLADSFKEGNMLRELRLSEKEIEYLKKKYPRAALRELAATQDQSDERVWYEVGFSSLG